MKSSASIEETYVKKTQLEHILLRPDSYIGSNKFTTQESWVYDESSSRIVKKTISFVPGFYKIFDEIIVNSADNIQRDRRMTRIKVEIDRSSGRITIENDGKGIPVVMHKDHKIYVPELIFGQLLTSSNYNDDQKKFTGGRNGFGAKLTNIFSKEFSVETVDSKRKRHFKMTWRGNMGSKDEPEIRENIPASEQVDFTRVSFIPDFKRFGMKKGLDEDIYSLLVRRVYDLAGVTTSKVAIHLNKKKIHLNSFLEYIKLYKLDDEEAPLLHEKLGPHWEVVVSISEGQFQQVSFVNCISTSLGGSHVEILADQISQSILDKLKKKKNSPKLKKFQIKGHLWIFVNCMVSNPSFSSQSKNKLTSDPTNFVEDSKLPDKFLLKIFKSGITDHILAQAQASQKVKLKRALNSRKSAKIYGIPKLEDANWAGTKRGKECLLILTEGDSAKSLAMAGIDITGRERFGVFPLRGKLLNVRDAKAKQLMANQEIQSVIKILGLKIGENYEDVNSLRYGGVMVMADQDHDGSHIKGLIINFIAHFWPSLFKMRGFIKQFVTPIIKVSYSKQSQSFFTQQDYQEWLEATPGSEKWTVKYYKGLGTSSDKEARQYFSNLKTHIIEFRHASQEDDKAMDLAFSKKKANERKVWLSHYNETEGVDHSIKHLRYTDFVNKELIHFAVAANLRAIPHVMDGLKPGQRKIMFSCFKRNLVKEVKVAQLAGYVSENSAYHHGEMSLCQTIIGMAQDFVWTNNINLLSPNGQFGSRYSGPSEAASPRYIYTQLSPMARVLFNSEDDAVVGNLEEEGQTIEPKFYAPIIPLALVNGASGIGTGWSTSIPQFDPLDLIDNVRALLVGQDQQVLVPWYSGFGGQIEKSADGRYEIRGNFEEEDVEIAGKGKSKESITILTIDELPNGVWTKNYKEFLEGLITDQKIAIDLEENHTRSEVNFTLKIKTAEFKKMKKGGKILKSLKLLGSAVYSNMIMFNKDGQLKKYTDPRQILYDYFVVRRELYVERKAHILKKLKSEKDILDNKIRFIREVVRKELIIAEKAKKDLTLELSNRGYDPMSKLMLKDASIKNNQEISAGDEEEDVSKNDYNYLLGMKLWSLTKEQIEKLTQQAANKSKEYHCLFAKASDDLWKEDLDRFEETYLKHTKRKSSSRRKRISDDSAYNKESSTKEEKESTDMVQEENNEEDIKIKTPVKPKNKTPVKQKSSSIKSMLSKRSPQLQDKKQTPAKSKKSITSSSLKKKKPRASPKPRSSQEDEEGSSLYESFSPAKKQVKGGISEEEAEMIRKYKSNAVKLAPRRGAKPAPISETKTDSQDSYGPSDGEEADDLELDEEEGEFVFQKYSQ